MLERKCVPITATVATAVANSSAINFENYAGGQVFVPAGSSITILTWYGSNDGVTYFPLYDGYGTAVTSSVIAGQACPIPEECFACVHLKAIDPVGGAVNLSLKT